jgi:hypothetical protein
MDLSIFLQPAALGALAGLIALELVLAVDNLIFITIVTNRLPPEKQPLRPDRRCDHAYHAAAVGRLADHADFAAVYLLRE